ncbi:hypothetical protein PG989_012334 [Apiospora arundinis]
MRDLLHQSPLTFTTRRLQKPAFAFLFVKHGAIIGPDERDAFLPTLNFTVDRNDLAVVSWLVEEGVPFLVKDARNQTPYQRAKRAGFNEIAQYLYDKARSGGRRGGSGHGSSISSVTLRGETVLDLEEVLVVGSDNQTTLNSKEKVIIKEVTPEALSFKNIEKDTFTLHGEEDKTRKNPLDGEDLQDSITKMRQRIMIEIALNSAVGGRSGMIEREMIFVGVIGLLLVLLVLR